MITQLASNSAGNAAHAFYPTVRAARADGRPRRADVVAGCRALGRRAARARARPAGLGRAPRAAGPGWEIGSHTRTHARLLGVDDARLADELAGSRKRIEAELGQPCRTIAYPFGEADERVIAAAGDAGYDAGCGLPTSFRRVSALAWPRTGVWHSDGPVSFRLKVARPVRLLQASPAFHALDRPRRAVKRVLHPGRIVRGWADD